MRADVDRQGDFTLQLLDALGTAWSTFGLYPDPVNQPAFVRAVEMLGAEIVPPLVVLIGPGTFLDGEEEVVTRRDGSDRLARELFLHDVEALRISGSMTSSDLLKLFRTIARDDEEVRHDGGISEVVAEHGKLGIEVFERGLLVLADSLAEEDPSAALAALMSEVEGMSQAAAAANRGAEPQEIAELLDDEIEGDPADAAPEQMVQSFLGGLAELHGHAAPFAETDLGIAGPLREGASDPWKGFRSFLEAFFHLPRPAQLLVLEGVLADPDAIQHQLFLDQLSGADLTDFLPALSEGAEEALTTYAVAVGGEAWRPGEGRSGLTSAGVVLSARKAVAARIGGVLASATSDRFAAEELLVGLRASVTGAPDDFALGTGVLRGLLECEDRPERFSRVLRVWTGRVSRHLRNGEWQRGNDLLDAVLEDPPYVEQRDSDVREALGRIAGRETLGLLMERERGSHPSDEALRLMETMGSAVVPHLVELLVREEDGQTRRLLTELLAHAARREPHSLDPHLIGQPWFLVRNLATVLAKTGRMAAVPGLQRLATHEDHRVRVEVLRGLVRIQGERAAATVVRMLEDPNERVRHTAATLARATDSATLDRMLGRELEEGRLAPDVAVVVVRILAGRSSSEARAVVAALAKRKLALKGANRAVRDAARRALEEAAR
ncbi:MAG: HEAT repeat domain-containing protein [Acidimicrobiia bacterium]